MGLYIFISATEMIDSASIDHMKFMEGQLRLEFHCGKILEYDGPFAKKIFDKIKNALDEDNHVYDQNKKLMEFQFKTLEEGLPPFGGDPYDDDEGPNFGGDIPDEF